MRYEDASQTGSTGSAVDARDDADNMASNDFGPATGNIITGAGTISGATGTDSSGHIVAIQGAGGSDNTFADGKLEIGGQYGTLTIDADGNYSYVRNPGSPDGVSETFTYTLANDAGATDTANLVISIGNLPMLQAEGTQTIQTANGVVILPAGVELSDVRVVGRDLVVTLPDGSTMVIPDGAVFVPQLVVNGVEVPASNLAALLIDSEPKPGAGDASPSQLSSGGNFELPVQPLDPGVPLGDLIPPTELQYIPPIVKELFPGANDEEPTIEFEPDGQPRSISAVDQVSEVGLPARNGSEPAGSGEIADGNGANNSDASETTTGTIVYDSPDGVDNISLNGQVITSVNQVIHGAFGDLTITSIASGAIGYSYTLADNTTGDNTHDDFGVILTDTDGDLATAVLVIDIIDDVPTARPDTDTVGVGGFIATGNVMTDAALGDLGDSDTNAADTVGADNASVTFIDSVNNPAPGTNVPNGGSTDIAGQFGTLHISSDGNYVYTRSPQSGGGKTEVFNYTLTDTDGDTSVTTLTITIPNTPISTQFSVGNVLDDDAQPGGNPGGPDDDGGSDFIEGDIGASGGDGGLTFTLRDNGAPSGFSYEIEAGTGNLLIKQGGNTVITVTLDPTTGHFTITQNLPIDHPTLNGAPGDDIENNLDFNITVRATDADGDFVEGTGLLNVDDDTPTISEIRVGSSVLLDETDGAEPVSSGAPIVATSADPMIAADISYGADGQGADPVYGLSLLGGGNSIASGLATADGDHAITLELTSSTLITGTFNGGADTAFTILMNSDGTVTVTQFTALEHLVDGSTPPDYDDALSLVISINEQTQSLVNATVTFEDGDGDKVSGSAPIGGAIVFEDDGPSINVTAGSDENILLITDDAGTEGAGVTTDSTTANFAGAFAIGSSSGGGDGTASAPLLSYQLATVGGASGLLSHGVAINLFMVGTTVVGATGSQPADLTDPDIVFTVSVDGNGVVTLTQLQQIDHSAEVPSGSPFSDQSAFILVDSLITLSASATITDNDGDTASDSETINIASNLLFRDDGPSVTITPAVEPLLVVDETNLPAVIGPVSFIDSFGIDFGADGPAGSNSKAFSLSVTEGPSGLFDTLSGHAVFLFLEGGQVVGREGTSALDAATGDQVFIVSVNTTSGDVTLDQLRAVVHGDPTDPDEADTPAQLSADDLIKLNVDVKDFDGDTATASLNIARNLFFEDDGPSISRNGEPLPSLVTDDTDTPNDTAGPVSLAGLFSSSFGNDGPKDLDHNGEDADALKFTLSITGGNGTDSGLDDVLTGDNILLRITGSGDIEGYLQNNTSVVAFTIDIDGNAGTVSLEQDRAITHNDPLDPAETGLAAEHMAGGLIVVTATITDGDLDTATATANIGDIFHFEDDGPSIDRNQTAAPTLVTDDTDTPNDTAGPVSFASLFDANFGKDGFKDSDDNDVEDADARTYSLSITGGNGTDSGLDDVVTGDNILLRVNGSGDIEGYLQNNTSVVAFTIDLNPDTGSISLEQDRAITHNDPLDPVESGGSAATMAAGLIHLNATIVDGDGDTDTASANIGDAFRFEDDGPSAVDDTDTVGAPLTSATGNVITDAEGDGGADDVGADTPGAIVGVAAGDTNTILNNPGTVGVVIQGDFGKLTLNSDGSYTYTRDLGSPGGGEDVFTYTLSDHDGDKVTATLTISIADAVPVAGTETATVDDDGLGGANAAGTNDINANLGETPSTNSNEAIFNGTLNATGGDAPLTFSLVLPAGNSTIGQETVSYGLVGNLLTATIATSPDGTRVGNTLFTVNLVNPGTGDYVLTLVDNVLHGDDANNDEDGIEVAVTVPYQVQDNDGSTSVANGQLTIQFNDDVPTAAINETGQGVSIDESLLNQADSNDVTGPLTVFNTVANKGDDPDAVPNPIQFATNATAIVNSTGTTLGADGGTTAFSLTTSDPLNLGVDSGLNATDGTNIFLFVESGLVVGRVGATAGVAAGGPAAFALAIDSTGHISMVQYLSVQHTDTTSKDESVSITDGALLAVVTASDADGDVSTASTAIGNRISFQDDAPIISSAQNMNIQNSGDVAHTAAFAFNVGVDGPQPTNDAIKSVTFSAVVNGVTVQATTPLTEVSENATTAIYNFSFTYGTGGSSTATENGVLTFNKAAGTYTVDLQDPIAGITVSSVQNGEPPVFLSYPLPPAGPGGDVANGVAVVDLHNGFFIQFTGQENVTTPAADFGNNDLWGGGTQSEVKISSVAIGVHGNSVQSPDVLDYNFYSSDPGNTIAPPTISATTAFIKVGQFNVAEDFVVTLKLADPATPGTFIDRTFIVNGNDVLTTAPAGFPALGTNEGYIIFEPNDYQTLTNVPDNYQIVGMQLRSSSEGVQSTNDNPATPLVNEGEVYSFNGAVGGAGGWSGTTEVFTAPGGGDTGTNDNDVFKIIDIGVVRTTTTNQNATLTFNVTIQDGDHDELSQTLTATVTSAVDSVSAIALPASSTTVVPLVLDGNGDGSISFLDHSAGVAYDFNGDGVAEATAWVGGGDSILVRDANGDGTVTDASEFQFGHDGLTDMQALAGQYGNALDANDADFGQFKVWTDANSNGVADAGELQSLSDAGITSIGLVSDGVGYTAASGDVLVAGTGSYTRADGSTGISADATFTTGAAKATQEVERIAANSNNVALAAAVAAAGVAASSAAAAAPAFDEGSHVVASALVAKEAFAGLTGTEDSGSRFSALSAFHDGGFDSGAQAMASTSHMAISSSHIGELVSALSIGSAPNALLDATDLSAAMQVQMPTTAMAVAMPSADSLMPAMSGVTDQHTGTVEQIVADALHGGGAGLDINALLNVLPGQGLGADAGLHGLATPIGDNVSIGDMGHGGGFTFDAAMIITTEAMVLHVDAVQPVANG